MPFLAPSPHVICPSLFPLISLCSLVTLTWSAHSPDDLLAPARAPCYSCASFAYLPLWSKLMHHYYPPRNFTDRCWQPDPDIGTVPCNSACFTIVERIAQHDDYFPNQKAVIRGCVDRLLLFGLDEDVKNKLSSLHHRQNQCRSTDRKILRLYPLSGDQEPVWMCSCVGPMCNDQDMLVIMNSSRKVMSSTLSLLALLLAMSWM